MPGADRHSPGFDSLEQEVFLNLWRTYDRLRAVEERLFEGYGLTPQQYNALRLLAGEHPNRLRTLELASRLVSHAPDITRLLDKLSDRGLIDRDRPRDNRRVVWVGITVAGRQLLEDLRGPLQECHERQLGHMSRKQLASLVKLLHTARGPHEIASSRWR